MGRTEARCAILLRILPAILALCFSQAIFAQTEPTTLPSSGDDLQVFLATMEPGDAPWERFGHDAIIILDKSSSASWAYNYGVFDFAAPNFIGNFVRGKMTYWMDVDPAGPTLAVYAQGNRSVWLDELNLSPAQRLKLYQKLEWNRRPENRYYRYDYYRDNCTIRVRDSLNAAVDGQISKQLSGIPTQTTFRSHTRIGMAEYFWLYTGLQLAMGPLTDRPLSVWEECFLPAQLMEHLKVVNVDDGAGNQVPLIKRSTQLYQSTRTPLPATPPRWWWIYFLTGLAIGGAMLTLARAGRPRAEPAMARKIQKQGDAIPRLQRLARFAFLSLAFFWSLICSLASLFLLFLWFFTDHQAGHRNENLFQFNPVSIIVLAATVRGFRWKISRAAVWMVFAFSALNVLLKILPWFYQVNWEMIALALPAHAGLVGAMMMVQKKQVDLEPLT